MWYERINGLVIGYIPGKGSFWFKSVKQYKAAFWAAFEERMKANEHS